MAVPSVSVLLPAYNQQWSIADAVKGVLDQNFSRIEIILSDDCSQDDTFEIMRRILDGYDGPHTVTLLRNEKNLGIGGHISKLWASASGDWIVVAAGDDISCPDRVSSLMRVAASTDRNLRALFSDYQEIDAAGKILGVETDRFPAGGYSPVGALKSLFTRMPPGACACWHRSLLDYFGPLDSRVQLEDCVLLFRALLLGRVHHVPEVLVKYRRHQTNVSNFFHSDDVVSLTKKFETFVSVFENCLMDLSILEMSGRGNADVISECRREISSRLKKLKSYLRISNGDTKDIFLGAVEVILAGGNPLSAVRVALRALSQRK